MKTALRVAAERLESTLVPWDIGYSPAFQPRVQSKMEVNSGGTVANGSELQLGVVRLKTGLRQGVQFWSQ